MEGFEEVFLDKSLDGAVMDYKVLYKDDIIRNGTLFVENGGTFVLYHNDERIGEGVGGVPIEYADRFKYRYTIGSHGDKREIRIITPLEYLTESMHKMLVSCNIEGVYIDEAMIWYDEGNDKYYFLQNKKNGYHDKILRKSNTKYTSAWGVLRGRPKDLENENVSKIYPLKTNNLELQEKKEVNLEEYEFFYSSRLGGKVWKENLTNVIISKI